VACRHFFETDVIGTTGFSYGTPAPKTTTTWNIGGAWNFALQDDSISFDIGIGNRDSREESLRIRMDRVMEKLTSLCNFDKGSEIHDGHSI
jgi:hypothetical protein